MRSSSADLKSALKKNRSAMIAYVIARNYWERARFRLGRIASVSGATTVHRPVEESYQYVRWQLSDWVRYAGLTPQRLQGARVVELGPGDSVGVALWLLAMGAGEVLCIDKYFPPHDTERERQLYLRIRRELSPEDRNRFDDAVSLEPELRFNEARIRYVYGKGAEDVDEALPPASADIVLSRAVLQCVDPDKSFAAINQILKPGGLTAHKIDLRDYGIFSANGHHPLEFLTLSNWLYWLIAHKADRPNRKHINYYRDKCASYGWQAKLFRCAVIAEGHVRRDIDPYVECLERGIHYTDIDLQRVKAIRHRLSPGYSELTDEELLCSSLFLVATKPHETA